MTHRFFVVIPNNVTGETLVFSYQHRHDAVHWCYCAEYVLGFVASVEEK